MERRRDKRWPRQLDAKFGVPNEKPHRGVVTNVSISGLFLRTPMVSPPGTRFRVEIVHSTRGFIVEGVVVRATKSPPHLQSVRPSGMGIRFLTPQELVEAMLPGQAGKVSRSPAAGVAATEEPQDVSSTEGSTPSPEEPAVAGKRDEIQIGRPVAESPPKPQLQIGTPVAESPAPEPPPKPDLQIGTPVVAGSAEAYEPPPVPADFELDRPVFAIVYRDLEQLKAVFERDIKTGGLFVPSPEPEPLDRIIQVEVGIEGERPVRVDARVVHSLEPQPGEDPANMLVGMGVQFTDPSRAILLFQKLIYG